MQKEAREIRGLWGNQVLQDFLVNQAFKVKMENLGQEDHRDP